MRIQFRISAGEDGRFAPGAFDGMVGKPVPWTLKAEEGGLVLAELGTATLVEAVVDQDGKGATLTAEMSDPATPLETSPDWWTW
jgi:hypothetical protein